MFLSCCENRVKVRGEDGDGDGGGGTARYTWSPCKNGGKWKRRNTNFLITCFRSSALADSSYLAWCWAVVVVVGGCNDDSNCGPPPPTKSGTAEVSVCACTARVAFSRQVAHRATAIAAEAPRFCRPHTYVHIMMEVMMTAVQVDQTKRDCLKSDRKDDGNPCSAVSLQQPRYNVMNEQDNDQ